jgi:hypothetical protein
MISTIILKNMDSKRKYLTKLRIWVHKNVDPRVYGATSLQKTLLKLFKTEYSLPQLSYLLHRLFHGKLEDPNYLISEVLQKHKDVEFKIGINQVI